MGKKRKGVLRGPKFNNWHSSYIEIAAEEFILAAKARPEVTKIILGSRSSTSTRPRRKKPLRRSALNLSERTDALRPRPPLPPPHPGLSSHDDGQGRVLRPMPAGGEAGGGLLSVAAEDAPVLQEQGVAGVPADRTGARTALYDLRAGAFDHR